MWRPWRREGQRVRQPGTLLLGKLGKRQAAFATPALNLLGRLLAALAMEALVAAEIDGLGGKGEARARGFNDLHDPQVQVLTHAEVRVVVGHADIGEDLDVQRG